MIQVALKDKAQAVTAMRYDGTNGAEIIEWLYEMSAIGSLAIEGRHVDKGLPEATKAERFLMLVNDRGSLGQYRFVKEGAWIVKKRSAPSAEFEILSDHDFRERWVQA